MKIKKVLLIILLIIIISVGVVISVIAGKKDEGNLDKIKITASNFASYDFLREIVGDNENIELTFLLGAGKDTHSYDPTPQDLVRIQQSKLFVYVGGEMESWSEKVLNTLDTSNTKIICIADEVDTIGEKEIDGSEEGHDHEHEEGSFDEHIWTSPKNAVIMVNTLEKAMEEIDSENAKQYKANADKYIEKINAVDKKIQNIVENKIRDRLIFGDKMPMQYFMDYYGLEVSAAFSGCSTETEPSSKTIAYLVDKAKTEEIPVILYIELSTGKVAETIANEVGNGCEPMQIQTLHNISKDDFNNGETYVTLMERNLDVLKKALQ